MNFEQIHNRWNTDSAKWDGASAIFGGKELHPMWVADMDFQVPEAVQKALIEKAQHGIYGYPHVPDSTYESIINWLLNRHNWNIEREWLSFSAGVVPAISILINALTEPGDKIIIQPPVYFPFFKMVEKNDRQLSLNTLKEKNGRYEMDFEQLESIIDEETKMLILCNPHNPVGRVWTKEELKRLGDICVKHNIIIVSDEIHGDLIFDGHKHIPFASISKEFAEITVTCMAPSKTFNLAGLQASYMIIENEQIRKKVNDQKVKQGMFHLNTFGLVGMEAAYQYGEQWLDHLLKYVEENVKTVVDFVQEQLPELQVIKPEGTYLIWIDCRSLGLDYKQLEKQLITEGKLALNQGYTFGETGKGFVRMNVATPKQHVLDGLDRLKMFVKSVRS
ncbi:PatB family C-S lyase [Bacillus tianshenii]|nr:PatB family C-S lyase [Bacillus tianshenii]